MLKPKKPQHKKGVISEIKLKTFKGIENIATAKELNIKFNFGLLLKYVKEIKLMKYIINNIISPKGLKYNFFTDLVISKTLLAFNAVKLYHAIFSITSVEI